MERLVGVIKNYAWGSTTHLAGLRGEQFSVLPESELWLGAHPVASATLPESGGIGLLEAIEANPDVELGREVSDRFGHRLPYLLKLLAADSPLSVQVHPSQAQAELGFAAENDAGLALDDPTRSFRDDNHKPEMIVALSAFEALVGFNTATAVIELIDLLDVDELADVRAVIEASGVAAAVAPIVSLDPSARRSATSAVAAHAAAVKGPRAADAALVASMAREFPGDPGVLLAMLLNRVVLEPGQAVYLGAGVLHSYVRGFGVEIMANCDNVVRGGLTAKHIDVGTLVDLIDPDAETPHILNPTGAVTAYETPAPEFSLVRLVEPDGWSRQPEGPEIILAVEGSTNLSRGDRELELVPGEAAWVRPGADPVELTSDGVVFVAAVGTG